MAADGSWLRIAITPETPLPDEGTRIAALLTSGAFQRVHLRHPGLSASEIEQILAAIPPGLHRRISLHAHPLTAMRFATGLHLNRRTPAPAAGFGGTLSRSCHTISEIQALPAEAYNYVTLSPIFDSLSKPGYRAAFTPESLKDALRTSRVPVIALGGVTPANEPQLHALGFAGCAMLTAAWQ